ncbi:MAG: aquaporin family protein [Fimbriimonadaceae bacterium]|nr:aquaporin family protein [Fimbriimonadaceae bacterium]
MRKLVTEFIGTFFLVLIIGLVVTGGVGATAVIGIGFGLMVLVYMGGPISGAHYNPAVTLVLLAGKRIKAREALGYVIAQFLAAFIGALIAQYLTGASFAPLPGAGVSVWQALLNEVLFTFLLVMVIHMVAIHPKSVGSHHYGFAIGATIVAAAYAGGAISGGAFNPAVGLGPSIVNMMAGNGTLEHAWIPIVGPIIGALLALPVYEFIAKEEPVEAP